MVTTSIPSSLRVVATRGRSCAGTSGDEGGTPTIYNSRIRVDCPPGATGVKLAYSNFSNGDNASPNAITVSCSIETSGGTIYPGNISGSATYLLGVSSEVIFDVPGLTLAEGSFCHVRTCVTASVGQAVPATHILTSTGTDRWQTDSNPNKALNPTGSSDLTTGGSFPASNSYDKQIFGPLAVLGSPINATIPSVGIYGDSIMQGTARPFTGYVGYALENLGTITGQKFPYIDFGLSGEQLRGLINGSATSYRVSVGLACCDAVVGEHLVNDISNGNTPAQMKADLVSWAALFAGKTKLYCTTTPRTTSVNGFKTPDDQVVWHARFGPGGDRDQMLAYLRPGGTGNALFARVFDVAAVLAALATGGTAYLWPVGADNNTRFTSDGLHPAAPGEAAAATAIEKAYIVKPAGLSGGLTASRLGMGLGIGLGF